MPDSNSPRGCLLYRSQNIGRFGGYFCTLALHRRTLSCNESEKYADTLHANYANFSLPHPCQFLGARMTVYGTATPHFRRLQWSVLDDPIFVVR